MNREYRYELKFIVSRQLGYFLKNQLRYIMDMDLHSISWDKSYFIRSLYFDDLFDTALREKVDGVEFRTKYRIRFYNHNAANINLECKQKAESLTTKSSIAVNEQLVRKIVNNDIYDIPLEGDTLLSRFLADKRYHNLIPAVVVDYDRLAFTYPLSDVRITFDEDIRSGVYNHDLFDRAAIGIPILDSQQCVMEVKFNEFLPESLMLILDTVPKFRIAISKFAFSCMLK